MTINRQEVLICQNSLCKNYELTIINKYIIDLNANTYLGFLQSWQTDGCNGRWPEGCGKKLQRINLKHFQSTYLIVTWKVIWDQIDNRDSVEGTFWVSFPCLWEKAIPCRYGNESYCDVEVPSKILIKFNCHSTVLTIGMRSFGPE